MASKAPVVRQTMTVADLDGKETWKGTGERKSKQMQQSMDHQMGGQEQKAKK